MSESQVIEQEKAKEYSNLGTMYAKDKKWNEAIDCYKKAIKIEPKFAGAYRNLGRVLTQIGNQKMAAECWYRALKLEPTYATAEDYLKLGETLLAQGKVKQAYACYCQARKKQPSCWLAYVKMGKILAQENKQEAAERAYQEAIKINSEAGDAYHQLGLILAEKGEFKAAIDCYEKALLSLPKSPDILDDYRLLLKKNSQTSAQDYFKFGKFLKRQGRDGEAIDCFLEALKLKPNFMPAHGVIQYTKITTLEKLEKLIDCYRKIVIDKPKLAIAWGNLGDALTQQGKIEEAIKCYQTSCYQKVIANHPNLEEMQWKEKKENAPDFIIIGGAKCGTTSLYCYLGEHPQILLPHKKEIKFFDEKFDLGLAWYLAHFPTITDNNNWLTGEASPSYLEYPQVAVSMSHLLPKVKVIVLLRNPVTRSVSWYYHQLPIRKKKKPLGEELAWEMEKLEGLTELEMMQLGRKYPNNILGSLYYYKIKNWMRIFPREQILILQSEKLYSQPEKTMEKVYEFLGIAYYQGKEYPQHNSRNYSPISDELRNRLTEYFRPHNQKLAEYLGMKFDWEEETR